MKIRTGFVSNSSSSSFIVAVKDKKDAKVTITLNVDLTDLSPTILDNKDALDRYMSDEWGKGWRDDPPSFYDECLEEISKGNILIFGMACNDSDNTPETILCDYGIPETKGITIIQNT